ncbi:MAG: leucine-rich repeat domain-containing protein [Eubacterium sp.]|nr:leucine-rich repeat domain-containing protein [Eubacterium sp.]
MLSKLKSKLAAVGSTEIIIWTLVSTVVATGVGLGVKAVTTGENGVMSNIEERINNAPDKIMNGSENSGAGGSGSEDLIPQTPSSPYGTLTKSWDISEAQDSSVTLDYYDDTKTAVVSGNGDIHPLSVFAISLGIDPRSYNDFDDFYNIVDDTYVNTEYMDAYNNGEISNDDFSYDLVYKWAHQINTLVIDDSITNLKDNSFTNAISVKNVIIPNSVTSIGNGAFEGLFCVTNIEIPKSVTSIGDYAFAECYKLSNVTVPSSVKHIGEYAFAQWDNPNPMIYCQTQEVADLVNASDPYYKATVVVDSSKF